MQNIIRSNFISHPFHLLSPSAWPIFTSFSLLTLTTSVVLTMQNIIRGNFISHPFHLILPYLLPIFTPFFLLTLTTSVVLTMQGFDISQSFLNLGLISLIASMTFWFRDVISGSTYQGFHTLAVQRGLNNNFVSNSDSDYNSPIKKNNSKGTNTNGLPSKKPNRFILFIKKLFSQIFTRKFLYSSLIIFITGFMGRYLIKSYFDIDVFKDYLHIISISFYAFMSIFTLVIRLVIYQLLEQNTTLMMIQDPNLPVSRGGQSSGGQSSSSGGQSSSSGGQPSSVDQPSSEGQPPIQPQGRRQSVPISDLLNPICEPLTPTEQDVNPNPELNREIEKEKRITQDVAERMYGSLYDKNRQIRNIEDNWNYYEHKKGCDIGYTKFEIYLKIFEENDLQRKTALRQLLKKLEYENDLELSIDRANHLESKAKTEQSLTQENTAKTEKITEELGLDPKSISACLEPDNKKIVKVRLNLKTGGFKDYRYKFNK